MFQQAWGHETLLQSQARRTAMRAVFATKLWRMGTTAARCGPMLKAGDQPELTLGVGIHLARRLFCYRFTNMTLRKVAYFATIAAGLQLLVFLISTLIPLIQTIFLPNAGLQSLNVMLPVAMAWVTFYALFFFLVYREQLGNLAQMPSWRLAPFLAIVMATESLANQISTRMAMAQLPQAALEQLNQFQRNQDWLAQLRGIAGYGVTFGWLLFLIAYALGREKPRARVIAAVLAALILLDSLYPLWRILSPWLEMLQPPARGMNGAAGRGYASQWIYHPVTSLWQNIIRPGTLILTWISQMLFFWVFSRAPLSPPGSSQTPTAPA